MVATALVFPSTGIPLRFLGPAGLVAYVVAAPVLQALPVVGCVVLASVRAGALPLDGHIDLDRCRLNTIKSLC